jgi:hypothetical protein
MDRKRPLGAVEKFSYFLEATAYTYQHEIRGEQPPVCIREMMLVETLIEIAKGDVPRREVRTSALEALQRWQRSHGTGKEE